MSLLMDALKKAELAKRQGQGEGTGDAAVPDAQGGLSLEPLADTGSAEPPAANRSPQALASHLEDLDTQFLAEAREAATARLKAQTAAPAASLAIEPSAEAAAGNTKAPRGASPTPRPQTDQPASQSQLAAQNVFAAKQVDKPPSRKAFGIVIGTLTFLASCAIGGYFWWQLQPRTSFTASQTPPPAAKPATAAVSPAPTVAAAAPVLPAAPAAPATPAASVPAATGAAPAVAAAAKARPMARDEDDDDAPVAAKAPAPRRQRAAPAVEADPDSPVRVTKAPLKVNPGLLRGYDAFNRGDLDLAQVEYERAYKADPRNTDAMHGLAAIALRQGRLEQADLLYRRIIEADPQDSTAMAALINNRTQIDPGMAESRLKSLSAAQPELAAPQFALGNLYAREGRWNEAQQAYFRAYGAEPDNPDILYNLAVSLEHLRQNKLAAQYYGLAIAAAQTRQAGFDKAQATVRLQSLQR